ncbi:MAG: YkgJ family cysteine cluster protein [Myxococcota bacterium]
MASEQVPERLLEYVRQIHTIVDDAAATLTAHHHARMQCRRGCASCCVDDITVTIVEAALIQRRHEALLQAEAPHPAGACAFLDDSGGCRIYDQRPYVCRTQGLPLRWIEQALAEDGEHEVFEYRDICPLNDPGGPPLETLDASAFWTLGPVEARLSAAQEQLNGNPNERVALRSLFKTR